MATYQVFQSSLLLEFPVLQMVFLYFLLLQYLKYLVTIEQHFVLKLKSTFQC